MQDSTIQQDIKEENKQEKEVVVDDGEEKREISKLKLEIIDMNKKIACFINENANLKDEIIRISEELQKEKVKGIDYEKLKQQLEEIQKEYSQSLKVIEEKEVVIKEKDKIIENKEKECYEIKKELDNIHQNEIVETEKTVKQNNDENIEETDTIHEKVAINLEEEIAKLQKEVSEKTETINKLHKEKKELEEYSLSEKTEKKKLVNENNLLNSTINEMRTTQSNNKITIDQLNQEKQQNKETIYKTNKAIEELNSTNTSLQNKVVELETHIKEKDEEITKMNLVIEQKQKSLTEKSLKDEKTIDELRKENQRLKSYIEQMPMNQMSQETFTHELKQETINKKENRVDEDIPIEPQIVTVDIPIYHYFTGCQEEIEINKQIFTIPISVGLSDGAEFNYKGYGTPINGRKRDLIIVTKTQQTESFRRQENNLFQTVVIPQSYRNKTFQCSIPCIDGNNIPVIITGQEGIQGPYERYGMPIGTTGKRGDLYLIIKLN
ncbi:GRIP domain containing protein RUD3 [Entamoeba histolytica HM-3:IMSS]|uniref:Chaperone DnaJ C-terminal domain-containing protein n=3 Tax=Entamoeba histolytica TaxID=5759 RepID=C4LUA2_ENTH1|nr:hypothetical protein EHI_110530 [Entamoeba histolytica HM-1:IMSS]EAL51612.1 hypothetical protein EHI_110530 [Entamoeba histolytica HM-1:IMSS]EMS11524.1 GRIP domain containing protein RUD3 [Entamoeba histolytica HM-3:IMSS]GAT92181.1 hypothetical protein CL6EHI_110530 [Entamoeba histolytica]|eukprot:XP_656998.1 hypothetical protein EHI_110530 [Entamoeba histolytica HM-1:IMSS]